MLLMIENRHCSPPASGSNRYPAKFLVFIGS
jgi:hypothetical protein